MKVKVIKRFRDLKQGKIHSVGDVIEVTADRMKEINSTKHGKMVKEIDKNKKEERKEDSNFPRHTGGGWYELSNGEKIKGKDAATKAEKAVEK